MYQSVSKEKHNLKEIIRLKWNKLSWRSSQPDVVPPGWTYTDKPGEEEETAIFASCQTGNDVISFAKATSKGISSNWCERKRGEARGVREMQSFTDDLPAVVILVCKFLYLFSLSHINSNVPPYWPGQYEFVMLLKSTLSSTGAHVVYQSALTAAPQYYNLAIPIPVPLFNNGLSITIVIIKKCFKNKLSVSFVEL